MNCGQRVRLNSYKRHKNWIKNHNQNKRLESVSLATFISESIQFIKRWMGNSPNFDLWFVKKSVSLVVSWCFLLTAKKVSKCWDLHYKRGQRFFRPQKLILSFSTHLLNNGVKIESKPLRSRIWIFEPIRFYLHKTIPHL